jgi:hypothetical protein
MNENRYIGESFDSFLHDEGIYDDVNATAIKRAIALKVGDASLKLWKGRGPTKQPVS